MPIWYEYRDKENKYVSEHLVYEGDSYELVICKEDKFPENSSFTTMGFIRRDLNKREKENVQSS